MTKGLVSKGKCITPSKALNEPHLLDPYALKQQLVFSDEESLLEQQMVTIVSTQGPGYEIDVARTPNIEVLHSR
jgi:hypothetical protein